MRAAYQLDGSDVASGAFYAAACDPRRHVVVEACAGAGKTWMLVARIVRALLDGAQPQEILAITFTRKAAGEMRTRLGDWLRGFAALEPEAAAQALVRFGLAPAEAAQRAPALIGLHERVLASGRAVEVRTFHAWYAQLLRAAPIELLAGMGLAPGLTPVEELDDLRPELMQAFHRALLDDAGRLELFRRLSIRHGRARLQAWLDTALERRIEIELADAAGTLEAAIEPPAERNALQRVFDAPLVALVRALARGLAERGGMRRDDAARGLIDALAEADAAARYQALRSLLFTDKGRGTPRRQLGNLPEQAALCEALDAIGASLAHEQACDDHQAMVQMSRLLFAQYAALKRRRGLIDMTDLERVAFTLLSDPVLSGWVQERLDAHVRHLLIDEFQDTSPLQWHALHAWLAAYAGAGGGPEAPRLFIVGDPKQSIYRFRRAEPRVFEAAQRFVVDALGGTLAACDHTRRCVPGVVGVINQVFGRFAAEGRLAAWRDHSTERPNPATPAPALWRLASAERPARGARAAEDAAAPVWRPSLSVPRVEAKAVLREAEAGALARAVEALVRDEGVAPQDIFVLARTRAVLAQAADALAALHLPHVAPEGLSLADLPEVQDLLAVLDVLASSGQALSLARALKSPLFGASDAELLRLARRAGGTSGWWDALMALGQTGAEAPPALRRAARLLAAWQEAAETLPPHDLLDRIVHEGEWLPRLAAVVPPERHARAMASARALLACALELDGGRYASPYGFVRALRQRRIELPASQQSGAVRLLTIHGAKGLEARVVFLMDADPRPPEAETATLLVDWPVDAPRPRRAAFVASEARCPPPLQALLAEEQAARSREEVNALYVALTRAEERVVVSRTPPLAAAAAPSWWARLEPLAAPWQTIERERAAAPAGRAEVVALPLERRRAPADAAPASTRDEASARLGQAVHRVLEWAARDASAPRERLAQAAAHAFGVADVAEVQRRAAAILDSPACRHFFDPAALAWAGNEVPVPGDAGEPRRIDRLVRLAGAGGAWWVLDYKLAASPQEAVAYREQLAGYRAAVAALVPGETVRAAFLTGRGELVALDDAG